MPISFVSFNLERRFRGISIDLMNAIHAYSNVLKLSKKNQVAFFKWLKLNK